MALLLLIDDDPDILVHQIRHVFEPRGVTVAIAGTGEDGVRQAAARRPDVVLLDVSLPGRSGLEVYTLLRRIDARIPVVFITATASTDTAIEAMRHGAYDYLFKPVQLRRLDEVVSEALEVSRRMHDVTDVGSELPPDDPGSTIIGRCAAMLDVYKAIGRVADQKGLVLITGESGTGKELVARAIYQHSERARATFLAINCAAIPETLLESELFGHEKGAFTGADRRRIGKFEQCNGGTLFLDEIGDMPLATQGKILRLLQDQRFERVGGNDVIATDVRLIAATNRDLKALSETGKFRPDLYYRLNVFTIDLPPLRRRGDDLEKLVNFYVRRFQKELNRVVLEIHPEAMRRLRDHSWPGNVRELQSVLKQAMLCAHGTVLLPEFLPNLSAPEIRDENSGPTNSLFEGFISRRLTEGSANVYAEAHLEFDRLLLAQALRFAKGNQLLAARILGIARQTLRNRLREVGLSVTRSVDTDEISSSNPA